MNQQIIQSLQLAQAFLANAQKPNGNYVGRSDDHPTDSLFFTALILDCLNATQEMSTTRRLAAEYLLRHKSLRWSWNYWERGSTARPYPDDLDDTACAIAGILGIDSLFIDASAQAAIAQNLIQCETKPGGPYTTWLVGSKEVQWRDVDPAVNANIGYMLFRLGVESSALGEYIETCLKQKQLQSPYYVGIIPTLYFIARWYQGACLQLLRSYITAEFNQPGLTSLHRAMLITAALKAGSEPDILVKHVQALLDEQTDDGWPSAPLYYEPPEGGKQRYAGSIELSTAFAVEALSTFVHWRPPAPVALVREPASLKTQYQQLLLRQTSPEVIDIASIIARAGGWKIKESALRHLNRGSRNGWLAYSIYDDFLDGEGNPARLNIANMAMRCSVMHFNKAVPDRDFASYVARIFDQVDAANAWELAQARNPDKLPRYGTYSIVAQRSWGHTIAPTGVMVLAGYSLTSPEVAQLQQFFCQYIIAKQLCDDAHDWLLDLRAKRITPVVTLLLKDLPHADDLSYQRHFWQYTIDQVNMVIRDHLKRAERSLQDCTFLRHKEELRGWLAALELSCKRAEQGRENARQFIDSFTSMSLLG